MFFSEIKYINYVLLSIQTFPFAFLNIWKSFNYFSRNLKLNFSTHTFERQFPFLNLQTLSKFVSICTKVIAFFLHIRTGKCKCLKLNLLFTQFSSYFFLNLHWFIDYIEDNYRRHIFSSRTYGLVEFDAILSSNKSSPIKCFHN